MAGKKRKQLLDRSSKKMMGLIGLLLVIIIGLLVYAIQNHSRTSETVGEAASEPGERTYMTVNRELSSANGIEITHAHIPFDSTRRPGEIREIRYVIIHETDNRSSGADAAAHSAVLTGDQNDIVSWHYTVDDHSIYHNIPDNEICWNAGDGRAEDGGNMHGIAIEMCVNLTDDYEKTLENTAALTAELLKTYGLTPDDVRLHEDFMDKICPHRLITEGRVDEFMQMIRDDYENSSVEGSEAAG
ncbi:MAG: N-acetylmuramoyl-L-alanine amidase family protein [Bulleidia sp.]